MQNIFVARGTYLKKITNLSAKKSAILIMVFGRRHIEKTRLIKEFTKKYNFFSFISQNPSKKITGNIQLQKFTRKPPIQAASPKINLSDWRDVLKILAHQTEHDEIVVTLDKISWVEPKDQTFWGKLKAFWDEKFKNKMNVIISLMITIAKELLVKKLL